MKRSEQAEVLVAGGDDLVARLQAETGEDDLTATRRGLRERDEFRGGAQDGREAS